MGSEEIDPEVQRVVLQHIAATWHTSRRDGRPWCVWVRLHKPLPPAATDARTQLAAVWFIDQRGILSRSPWDYARFHVVHFDQPWCARVFPEDGSPVFGHRTHEIGLAAFASYADSNDLYLEMNWLGTGGHGSRISVEPDGSLRTRRELWIS